MNKKIVIPDYIIGHRNLSPNLNNIVYVRPYYGDWYLTQDFEYWGQPTVSFPNGYLKVKYIADSGYFCLKYHQGNNHVIEGMYFGTGQYNRIEYNSSGSVVSDTMVGDVRTYSTTNYYQQLETIPNYNNSLPFSATAFPVEMSCEIARSYLGLSGSVFYDYYLQFGSGSQTYYEDIRIDFPEIINPLFSTRNSTFPVTRDYINDSLFVVILSSLAAYTGTSIDYPITYIPINSTLSGPATASSGDNVSVDVSFPDGYIYRESGISVYDTNGAIAHSYDPTTGKLTFTMP